MHVAPQRQNTQSTERRSPLETQDAFFVHLPAKALKPRVRTAPRQERRLASAGTGLDRNA